MGFQIDEKAVRRAGLDYWKAVDLQEHENVEAFWMWAKGRRVYGLSTKSEGTLVSTEFHPGAVLLFGPETRGLPVEVRERITGVRIPMTGEIRSLNLSNAVAVASYAALAQIRPPWFGVAEP